MSKATHSTDEYMNVLMKISMSEDIQHPDNYFLLYFEDEDDVVAVSQTEDKYVLITPDLNSYCCGRLSTMAEDGEAALAKKIQLQLAVRDALEMLIEDGTLEKCEEDGQTVYSLTDKEKMRNSVKV